MTNRAGVSSRFYNTSPSTSFAVPARICCIHVPWPRAASGTSSSACNGVSDKHTSACSELWLVKRLASFFGTDLCETLHRSTAHSLHATVDEFDVDIRHSRGCTKATLRLRERPPAGRCTWNRGPTGNTPLFSFQHVQHPETSRMFSSRSEAINRHRAWMTAVKRLWSHALS